MNASRDSATKGSSRRAVAATAQKTKRYSGKPDTFGARMGQRIRPKNTYLIDGAEIKNVLEHFTDPRLPSVIN